MDKITTHNCSSLTLLGFNIIYSQIWLKDGMTKNTVSGNFSLKKIKNKKINKKKKKFTILQISK